MPRNKKSSSSVKPNIIALNEEELIHQIEIRPVLYTRHSRKVGLRNLMWKEVSKEVGASVGDCQKRWRSLRDAYVKHYKGHLKRKRKWVFFDQMSFLAPQLDSECNNLSDFQFDDDDYIDKAESSEEHEESITASRNDKKFDSAATKLTNVKESTTLDEDLSHSVQGMKDEASCVQEKDTNTGDNDYESCENNHRINSLNDANSIGSINNEQQGLDGDEHFLLSCAPALRRLNARQNSLARIKIQQILYDIEFT